MHELRVRKTQRLHDRRPLAVGGRGLRHDRRIEVHAAVLGEASLEVVGDLVPRLHPEECLGVPGVTAPLMSGRAFEHDNVRPGFERRDCGGQTGDAAPGDEHFA
jgi:hypothetical protein